MSTTKRRRAPARRATKKGGARKSSKRGARKTKAAGKKKKTAAKKRVSKVPKKRVAKSKRAPAKRTKKKVAKSRRAPAKRSAVRKAPKPTADGTPAWVAPFLTALPPVDALPPTEARLRKLAARVPPELLHAWRSVGWGRFGRGFVVLADPQELEELLDEWLGGPNPARIPLGWTALGDLLYFRDLRERARQLGFSGEVAESACDVNVVDVRYKRVSRLSTSVPDFFRDVLGDPEQLRSTMRKDLFDAALPRLGSPEKYEIYGFVPALALGGSESPQTLQRVRAREHLALLFQL